MLPVFLLGVFVFLSITLLFQSFYLTEYILGYGLQFGTVVQIILYISIGSLAVILPMALLFAVLLTYGRLSTDSELIALKALGLNNSHFLFPAVVLGLLVCFLSAQTSFYLAPWGNRKVETLLHQLKKFKPQIIVKEGVFSDFFDIIIYANKVDQKTGLLEKVFIYDERKKNSPLTITAKVGKLTTGRQIDSKRTGNSAYLQLVEGSIHRASKESYTKVDFKRNEIKLFDTVNLTYKKKTPRSYSLSDLEEALRAHVLPAEKLRTLSVELHRRWAFAIACLIFAVLGVGLGTTSYRRSGKSTGFVLCLGVVIVYWALYASLENMSKSGTLPVVIAVWAPNTLFAIGAWLSMRRVS